MSQKLQSIMHKSPVIIAEDECLDDAIKLLDREKSSHLIVVDDKKKLTGIISKGDILDRLKTLMRQSGGKTYNDVVLHTQKVRDFMTHDPEYLKESDEVDSAVSLFKEKQFHVIPVVDDQMNTKGVVRPIDIIQEFYHP